MNEGRFGLLRDKSASILNSQSFSLDQLDESLTDSIRRGAKISVEHKALALTAAAKIASGAPLDQQHKEILESIVLGNGLRPAFDIVRDSFDPLPSAWADVNAARDTLTRLIRAVGRINVFGHPMLTYVGTAFVCGENLLLTNRHVVELISAVQPGEAGISFRPGISANVDLKQEVAGADATLLELTGRNIVSQTWDAAVLEVKSLPAGISPLPMRGTSPTETSDRTAAVVGYPAFDPAENLFQQLEIFRGLFDKKRLEPGKFTGYEDVLSFGKTVRALKHDCTTLGGSSGSAAIDVASGLVFGLHFGGQTSSNFAVPIWELAQDVDFASVRDRMAFS